MIDEKQLMKLQNGSDIRGTAVAGIADEPVNLTQEAVRCITGGFLDFLTEKNGKPVTEFTIAVGHDSRISAPDLKRAVLSAILSRGAKAIDCGLSSTPAMFMSILFDETKADASIMITASHLPYNRNGMKFFTERGGLEASDIKKVLSYAAKNRVPASNEKKAASFDLLSVYASHLRKKICEELSAAPEYKPLAGMHIVIDAGNGSGGFFASKVLTLLGADTTGSRYLEPDGMFPNHIPNPENKEAMAAIKEAVLENHADLGLIFDTDVDRMSAVLPTGEEINRNALIAMMAAILAPDYPNATIVTDSVTSDELTCFLENELHLHHHRFKRGYKNVINECIRLNEEGTLSPLAIETSGHGALSENHYLDDGAYLAVKLLIAATKAKKEGRTLQSLIERLAHPLESSEYRLKIKGVEDVKDYAGEVLNAFAARAKESGIKIAEPSYEGVRLIFPQGWALLRMSLHDPNMPLNIESREKGGTDIIAKKVKTLLSDLTSLDLSVL